MVTQDSADLHGRSDWYQQDPAHREAALQLHPTAAGAPTPARDRRLPTSPKAMDTCRRPVAMAGVNKVISAICDQNVSFPGLV